MKIDLLRMAIENNEPHWLSPQAKQSDLMDEIRAKNKAKHDAKMKRESDKAKANKLA